MHKFSSFLAVGALAAAMGLGGCTSQQEQQILNDIQAACVLAPIVVTITSSIPGVAPIAPILMGGEKLACSEGYAAVQAAIEAITAAGGTATVTVASRSASVLERIARHLSAHKGMHVKATAPGKIVVVVPPSPLPFL